MSNQGVYGCDMCDTTLGRQGCPIHRSWRVPVLDTGIHEPEPVDIQGQLTHLASERYEQILVLERHNMDLSGEVRRLSDMLAAARERCIAACLNERVSGESDTAEDAARNRACRDCADAIGRLG